ncbi:MAG: hypothetical protein V1772_06670 [Chloroflexota bacterium]
MLWSEEYQAQLLTGCLRAFAARNDLVGYCIWQFRDTRSDGGQRALRLPRGHNKGLVNEYRQPKRAYSAVRDLLRAVAGRPVGRPPADG